MKHYPSILLFFALLGALPAFGQTTTLLVARTNTNFSFSLPDGGDSTTFAYNNLHQTLESKRWTSDITGIWVLKSRLTDFTYDNQGKRLFYRSQLGDDVNGWVDSYRYTNTYNAEGKELSDLQEKWDGTNWITQWSVNSVYDANGNKLSSTGLGFRNLYTYNPQGQLDTVRYQEINGSWVNKALTQYTYLPNDTIVETKYFWLNEWKKDYRNTDAYDTNGNLLTNLYEQWNGTTWVNGYRTSHIYDTNGYVLQDLTEYPNGTAWENSSQVLNTYDANHNLIAWLSQTWTAGNWENSFRASSHYDANSHFSYGGLENWNGTSWEYFVFGRNHYAEFVSTHTPALTAFEIFPNPASTSVTLSGTGLSRAMLFDQQGRLVYVQNLQGQDQETLQLGNLPTGNYFLQVLGADGRMGAKPLQIRR